jgi:transposase-like protein
MSGQPETTASQDASNTPLHNGLSEGLPSVAEILLNAAMLLERAAFLQAAPDERGEQRLGHANGFKHRSLSTPIGKLNLLVPQTRSNPEPFRTSLLESGSRVDRALKAAIAEMDLQGVSTRRVEAVLKEL